MATLKVDIPEEKVKTVLKLKKSSQLILDTYSTYLSELHRTPVSKDVIIDSLLEKLSKDKDFKKKMKLKN
jgi:hypothetical protein